MQLVKSREKNWVYVDRMKIHQSEDAYQNGQEHEKYRRSQLNFGNASHAGSTMTDF
jgi:adenine specific DNA methylase Mod